jgi:NTE family protein
MPCHRPQTSSNTLHQPSTGAAPTHATSRRSAARLVRQLARGSGQIVLAVAGLCLGTSASAQAPMLATVGVNTPPSAAGTAHTGMPRPKIGLVLSGGGARGFAHVGVLKALEAAHVPVDVVVGTSMGAIVGGLYASGMSPQALETELMGVAWDTLFERRTPRQTLSQQRKEADFDLSPVFQIGFRDGEFRVPSGAVSTRSLEWLLRRYTLHTRQLTSFDALPTPFRAVATNMETGEPVVLANGDLAAALRASMSVPGVFAPLEVDGRLLGDGGLVNNLPVDVARALGADVVIAVNIGTPLAGRESLGSVLGVSAQMINILTEQNVQRSVATLTRHDLLLAPPLGTLTSADFSEAARIAELGAAYAATVSEALARFAIEPQAYAEWQLNRKPGADTLPRALAFIRFDGVSDGQAQQLQRLIDVRPGDPLDHKVLHGDLLQLAASGDYEKVDYRLTPDAATLQEGLVFDLKTTDWGPNYLKLGLDLRTDFQGDAGFNLRLHHSRHWLTPNGTLWNNQLEIGNVTGLRTELVHPLGGDHDRFVALRGSVRREKITVYDGSGTAQGLYARSTATAAIAHGWTAGRGGNLGTARVGVYASRRLIEPELVNHASQTLTQPALQWTEAGLKLGWVADQLDYAHFPQSGYRMAAEATFARRRISGETAHFSQLEWQGNRVFTWGPHTLNVFGRVARAGGMPAGSLPELSLGGFQQLSGYKVGQVAGNHLALGRIEYYHRLAMNPGVARALFMGGSIEVGNAWQRASDIGLQQLKMGYSLYVAADTGLGPVYFGWVHAKSRSPSIYLFLGKP